MSTINIEGTFSTTIRVGTCLNINLTDDLDVEGRIDLYGNLSIGAHNITVLDFSRFYGSISGSGSYISDISSNKGGAGGGCTASSNYPFPVDSSTFTGSIVLSGDMSFMVIASGNSFFGRHASSITVNDEARIGFVTPYGQDATFDIGPITMNGGGLYVAQDLDSDCDSNDQKTEATLNSSITFLKNTDIALSNVNLNLKQATGRQYIKLIEGQSGHVIVDGETVVSQLAVYDVTDAENCSYLYNANYINNKVVVGLDCAADDYFPGKDKDYPVGVRGILAGTGKVGYVLVRSGGVVAPGMSPGTLTVLGIEWLEGGIYEFEIGANGSDLIVSEGDVKLGNGTLSVLRFEDYVPAAGTVYTIIQNDSANPVDGTFLNLPEGATFETADGGVYRVSYVGGDGNDVTLTVITTPTVPNTGLGMIRNNPMVALVASIISALTILVVQRRLATRSK